MTLDKIVLLAFSVFLFFGAYMGYVKGSKMSLIMGSVSGLLVLLGLWIMTFNPKVAWIVLISLSSFLVVTFLLRVIKTQNFMPAGILLLVSLAVAIFCAWRFSQTT